MAKITVEQIAYLPKIITQKISMVINPTGIEDIISEKIVVPINSAFHCTLKKYTILGQNMPESLQCLLIGDYSPLSGRFLNIDFEVNNAKVYRLKLKIISGYVCNENFIHYINNLGFATQDKKSFDWEIVCLNK